MFLYDGSGPDSQVSQVEYKAEYEISVIYDDKTKGEK